MNRFKQVSNGISWPALGLSMVLGGLLAFLYLGAQGVPGSLHLEILRNLAELREKSAVLDQELIKTRFRLNVSFDPLVKSVMELKDSTSHFEEDLHDISQEGTDQAWQGYRKAMTAKLRHIEQFKSRNAILKNFLDHYPLAINHALESLGESPDDRRIKKALADLLQAVLVHNLKLEGQALTPEEALNDLKILKGRGDAPNHIASLIRRTERIIQIESDLAHLTEEALGLHLEEKLGRFAEEYNAYFLIRQEGANKYQSALTLLSGAMVFALAWFILRLARTSNTLQKTVKELQFQKYALDEHAIVSIADAKGNITYVNDKFCEISEYDRSVLIGKNHRIVRSTEHDKDFFRQMWQQISSGKTWHGQIKNSKKNGGDYWVESTIVPFLDERGKPFQYISIRTDITRQVQNEQELQHHRTELVKMVEERTAKLLEAKEEADKANQLKSQFIANISHELRTPMHGILSFAEKGVKRGEEVPTQQRQKFFQMILTSGNRLMKLLDELLDLSKLEAGRMVYKMKKISAAHLVELVEAEFAGLLKDKGLALELVSRIEEDHFIGDEDRLLQVFRNLFSNAIRYSPEAGMILVTIEEAVREGKRYVHICVSDQGVGIPEEELEAVFDKFIQSSKTHDGAGGTGLGLAISREIIEDHQGRLWAENRAEGGAMFRICLPRHRHMEKKLGELLIDKGYLTKEQLEEALEEQH